MAVEITAGMWESRAQHMACAYMCCGRLVTLATPGYHSRMSGMRQAEERERGRVPTGIGCCLRKDPKRQSGQCVPPGINGGTWWAYAGGAHVVWQVWSPPIPPHAQQQPCSPTHRRHRRTAARPRPRRRVRWQHCCGPSWRLPRPVQSLQPGPAAHRPRPRPLLLVAWPWCWPAARPSVQQQNFVTVCESVSRRCSSRNTSKILASRYC